MKNSVARFLATPGTSEIPWVLLYTAIVTMLMLAWTYVPA